MHTISIILQTLSLDDKRNFIAKLQRNNKRTDTKNIQLLRLLDTTVTVQDADIALYGKKNKGAYHALCKRVQDSLIDFIATQSFETATSEDMAAIKLLRASRIFFAQQQYAIGFKTLKKATQKAKAFDHFSILNEIYYTHIQYVHFDPHTQLQELIVTYTANKEALQLEERLNLFYAHVQEELQNNLKNVAQILTESLAKFDIIINSNLSFRSLFKILEVGNTAAHVLQDHYSLLPFVITAYEQIDTKKEQSETHLFYHIQILYFVTNAYFRNRLFQKAQYYLTQMYTYMCAQEGQYYQRFAPQYTLLEVLILTYTGQLELAITRVTAFDSSPYLLQQEYILDLQLAQVVLCLLQENPKDAYAIVKSWYHSDTWYRQKVGTIWVIQKDIIEILLLIELDYVDLVASRLLSFRKKHQSYVKENGMLKILAFIRWTTQWYTTPDLDQHLLNEQVTAALNAPTSIGELDDIFLFTILNWLHSKITNKPVYPALLERLRL